MIYFCIGTQCNIGRVAKLASIAIHRGCGTGIGLAGCYCQGITKETSLLRVHFSRFIIIWTCFLQIFFLIFWYFSFHLFRCRFLHFFFFIFFQCKYMLGIYVSIVRIIIIFLDKNQLVQWFHFYWQLSIYPSLFFYFKNLKFWKLFILSKKFDHRNNYHILSHKSNDPWNGYILLHKLILLSNNDILYYNWKRFTHNTLGKKLNFNSIQNLIIF